MTRVWPALWPPWKRTTTPASTDSQSTILPLPSSPHWAPTTTTFATLRLLTRHAKNPGRAPGSSKPSVSSEIDAARSRRSLGQHGVCLHSPPKKKAAQGRLAKVGVFQAPGGNRIILAESALPGCDSKHTPAGQEKAPLERHPRGEATKPGTRCFAHPAWARP